MAITGRPTGVANTGESSVLAVRVLEDAVLQQAPLKEAAPNEGGWLGVLGGCSRGGRAGGASPRGVGTEPHACNPASVAAPMVASRPVLLATWSAAWPCGDQRGRGGGELVAQRGVRSGRVGTFASRSRLGPSKEEVVHPRWDADSQSNQIQSGQAGVQGYHGATRSRGSMRATG